MRILFFTSLKGVHGRKWVAHFLRVHEVHVATFKATQDDLISGANIHQIQNVERLPIANDKTSDERTPGQLSAAQQAWLTFKIGIRYAFQFTKLIDALKPDIIHAHQSVPFGWYALCAGMVARHKAPLLVSVWGTDVMAYPDQSRLYRWINRQVLQRATKVTATSSALRRAAMRFAPGRIIDVVPFGVDTKLFKSKEQISDSTTIFGIAKYLKPVYRIDIAIKALAIAQKSNPALRLELAGSGPEENNLRRLVTQLNLNDSVTFLGAVSQTAMPSTMATWDAMLILSRQESFGVAALEASAVGIPVIAARVGGLVEVIEENITGVFVDQVTPESVAKAMLRMSQNKSLARTAHKQGPIFVRDNFEWKNMAEQMDRMYQTLV